MKITVTTKNGIHQDLADRPEFTDQDRVQITKDWNIGCEDGSPMQLASITVS